MEHTNRTIRPLTQQDLEAYPVSPRVNDARNHGPELMEKIQPPPAGLFRLEEL